MTTTKCTIEFIDNPQKIYFAGQTIYGRVSLTLEKSKRVRGIYAQIEGKGHCEWATGSNQSNQNFGDELYLSERKYLVGSDALNGSELINIDPGLYFYTFECHLPNVILPTSFEAKIGFIRYSVRVNLDRPLWRDQYFEKTFKILKPYDLTDSLVLRRPIELKQISYIYSFCCLCICLPLNEVMIEGHLPMTGYIPGQTIDCNFTISNGSRQDINGMYIRIIKSIQYFTSKNSKQTVNEEIIIAERSIDGCNRGKIEKITSHIRVPQTIPTDTSSSDICKIQYILRIIADMHLFCEKNPSLDIPITIGTYTSTMDNTTIGWCCEQPSTSANDNNNNHNDRNYGSIQQQPHPIFESTSQLYQNPDLPTYSQAIAKMQYE